MQTAYEIVTESIIKQLEPGVAPWRKPWRTEPPANLVSKKDTAASIFSFSLRTVTAHVTGSLIIKRKHWAEPLRRANVVPRLSSGRSTNIGRRTRRQEKRKIANRFCCATTLFSMRNNARVSSLPNE